MRNLLTQNQAAEYLGINKRTLENWRYAGRGPEYVRLSHRAVRYRQSDLEKFVDERVYQSTAHEAVEADTDSI